MYDLVSFFFLSRFGKKYTYKTVLKYKSNQLKCLFYSLVCTGKVCLIQKTLNFPGNKFAKKPKKKKTEMRNSEDGIRDGPGPWTECEFC